MDFSEVAAEVRKKVVMPDIEDVEDRINSAFKTTRRFDEERPAIVENKLAGVNQSLLGPTEEEKRLEEQHLAEEKKEQAMRINHKKQELAIAQNKHDQSNKRYWDFWNEKIPRKDINQTGKYKNMPWYPELQRKWRTQKEDQLEVLRLKRELSEMERTND